MKQIRRRGYRQSPEHIAKRVASGLKTRALWNDEQKKAFSLKTVLSRRSYVGAGNPNWKEGVSFPRGQKRGAAHHCWKGGPVSAVCESCGIAFMRNRAEAARTKPRFCSTRCKGKALQLSVTVDDRIRRGLNARMTTLMHRELGRAKAGRKWQELAGYSTEVLRLHLESRFLPGMSWDNRGKWHIDHIRPRASYRFVSAEDKQFRACWALENLQPLWAIENMNKHTKNNKPFQPSLLI